VNALKKVVAAAALALALSPAIGGWATPAGADPGHGGPTQYQSWYNSYPGGSCWFGGNHMVNLYNYPVGITSKGPGCAVGTISVHLVWYAGGYDDIWGSCFVSACSEAGVNGPYAGYPVNSEHEHLYVVYSGGIFYDYSSPLYSYH